MSLVVLDRKPYLGHLHAILRDKYSQGSTFTAAADKIASMVLTECMNHVYYDKITVCTPTGAEFSALRHQEIVGVSIMRAGESMEGPLRNICPEASIGKILIQRDEKTAEPHLFYSKVPVYSAAYILMDPMLATGGTACMAIDALKEINKGHTIIFANIIAAPEGIERVRREHPDVKIVTSWVDSELNDKKYIIPGCGDYGDRYFGTD